MALIRCPECGKEISDTAKACVNCGFTIQKWLRQQAAQEAAEQWKAERAEKTAQRRETAAETAPETIKASKARNLGVLLILNVLTDAAYLILLRNITDVFYSDIWSILSFVLPLIPGIALFLHARNMRKPPIIMMGVYLLLLAGSYAYSLINSTSSVNRDDSRIINSILGASVYIILLIYLITSEHNRESKIWLILITIVYWGVFILRGGMGVGYYTSAFSDEFNEYAARILQPVCLGMTIFWYLYIAAGVAPKSLFRSWPDIRNTKRIVWLLQAGATVSLAVSFVFQYLGTRIIGMKVIEDYNQAGWYYYFNQDNSFGYRYGQKMEELWTTKVKALVDSLKNDITFSYVFWYAAGCLALAAMIVLFISSGKSRRMLPDSNDSSI